MCNIASALGVWREGDPVAEAPLRAADKLEEIFKTAGLPVNASELGIPVAAADAIFASSLKNFNADPKQTFRKEPELIKACLLAAW
jgi:hypothetical protein